MDDNTSSYLALNIRRLRSARQLSQQKLATLAGIPRPTLAHLESGSANPTLSVLMRLASALQVMIEELIIPPKASAKHFSAEDLPTRQRGLVSIRKLLPDPIRGFDIERILIPAGEYLTGIPQTRGSRRYVINETGSLQLSLSGETYSLEEGDVLTFRGDHAHTFHNPGTTPCVVHGVITLAPVPD